MSTTLEILAPYLPYGIELMQLRDGVPTTRRWPMMTALQLKGCNLSVNQQPDNSVRLGQHEVFSPVTDFLPVLRSFADLCTPLEDGTVPAEGLAWLAHPTSRGEWKLDIKASKNRYLVLMHTEKDIVCHIENNWQINLLSPDLRMAAHLSNQHQLADYLRRHHFAVGLQPDQYIRKEATDAR